MPLTSAPTNPLPLARDRLFVVTSRLLVATWIPAILFSAISVWDRPAVRGVVLLTAATVLVAALVIWRPSRQYAWLQASLFLGLLAVGIPASGGVSGITPGGMATLTVLVAWASLYFGRRGLWGMLAVCGVLLAHTAWQFVSGTASAPPPPDLTNSGYWWRNALVLLSTFALGGLIVRAAVSAYDDALAAERDAQRRAALEEAARQTAEAESVVLQRREAAAALAAGVAHDIANVLQVSTMHAESLLDGVQDEAQREAVREILLADERARRMVRDLLAIGRDAKSVDQRDERSDREYIDGRALFARLEMMLASTLPSSIRRTFTVGGTLQLRGDTARLEQVMLNLVFNARDAMPNGGTLRVSLNRFDEQQAVIEVTDSGTGIAPEVREQMFKPFFTTKSSRDGSGLGLSMVVRIVEAAGGRIEVDSVVGKGSTFTVYWPLLAPA